jgi:hypothetical protein
MNPFFDIWGVVMEWFLDTGVVFGIAWGKRWEKIWRFWIN